MKANPAIIIDRAGQLAWDFPRRAGRPRGQRFDFDRVADAMKLRLGPVADSPACRACCVRCKQEVPVIDTKRSIGFRDLPRWLVVDGDNMPHRCPGGTESAE